MDWRSFEIETANASSGHCDCCGTTTRRISGYIHRSDGATVAAYFVGWTEDRPDHGAAFDLIFGKWGEGATKRDRCAAALDFRVINGTGQFTVVDATGRVAADSELVGNVLQRSDVIGTPIAEQVFALVDAIYMGDSRLAPMRGWSRS